MTARRAVVAGIASLSLLTMGAAAPGAAESSAPAAAKSIAHRIHTGTLEEATNAMAEAFAWAGVTIIDAEGKTVAKGIAPTIPVTMRSFEMQKAALSARGAPTTDLADLAKLIADLGGFQGDAGSPEAALADLAKLAESGKEITEADLERLGKGVAKQLEAAQSELDGERAGIVFLDVFGEMIKASRTAPRSAHNFVPLLIEALANERGALDPGGLPLSFTSELTHPEDVRLTLAEAELFLLMFGRGEKSSAELPVRYASLDMPVLAAPARSGTACADLLDAADDYAKSALPHAADKMGGGAVDTFYEWMKQKTGFAYADALKTVVGYAYKAVRLMTWLLDSSEFELTPTPTDAHYSHQDGKEVEVTFKAEVQLPSGGDGAGAEAAGCLNTFFGFNLPDSPAALAKSMKDWRVFWELEKLDHASVSPKNSFSQHVGLGNGLKVSGTKGTSELIVNLAHEEPTADARGVEKTGKMIVTAKLDQSAAFDPTLLFKGGKAGAGAGAAQAAGMTGGATLIMADVVLDVLIEWAKKVFPRTADATVNVTWHEPKIFAWEGTISQVTTVAGTSEMTQKTFGRAPPAMAVGVSIAAPGQGSETFHHERKTNTTMTVTVKPGREDQRIHPYKYISEDFGKTTQTESTPEVCMVDGGKTWKVGTWTIDALNAATIKLKGTGYTTVTVKFEDDGTYWIDAPIPYATGSIYTSNKYQGDSSCTGRSDPENLPLTNSRGFLKAGPFRINGSGTATADVKVLTGRVSERIDYDKSPGTTGTVTTTWNLKRVEVK